MKELNKTFPLITWKMMLWHVFTALIIFLALLVFIKADKDTPLKAYFITAAAGIVLLSIPIYGFVRQLQCRLWVRKHVVAVGYNVLYLAHGIPPDYNGLDRLKTTALALSTRDVLGETLQELKVYGPASIATSFYKRPKEPTLIIAQLEVYKKDTPDKKPWKVLGLQLGRRLYITWGGSVALYQALVGHELGELVLTVSGYQGGSEQRHRIIGDADLENLLTPIRRTRPVPRSKADA